MVRRGERPLRRHLGEVTKPSRRRGCLRTYLEAVGRKLQITSAVVKVVLVLRKLCHGCRPYNFCYIMIYALHESLKTVKRLVVDDLCKSSQVRCAVN